MASLALLGAVLLWGLLCSAGAEDAKDRAGVGPMVDTSSGRVSLLLQLHVLISIMWSRWKEGQGSGGSPFNIYGWTCTQLLLHSPGMWNVMNYNEGIAFHCNEKLNACPPDLQTLPSTCVLVMQ